MSGGKYACGVGIALDGAHGCPADEFASEYAATSACEKSQLIHLMVKMKIGVCGPT